MRSSTVEKRQNRLGVGPRIALPAVVYAAWIVLIIPGITLLTRLWLLMITPLVASTVFKLVIRVEDHYLRLRFGPPYLEYCIRVNELIPRPRL